MSLYNELSRCKSDGDSGLASDDLIADVAFLVEGRWLYFNRTCLTACSPVFSRMFAGLQAGSPGTHPTVHKLQLPGKRYGDVETFFQLLHPLSRSVPISDDRLMPLLALAEEYQVAQVSHKCESYIGNQLELVTQSRTVLNKEKALLYLKVCEKFGLMRHRDLLLHMLSAGRTTRELVSRAAATPPAAAAARLYFNNASFFRQGGPPL